MFARTVTVKTVPSGDDWNITTTLYAEVSQNYTGSLQALIILDPVNYTYISFTKSVTLYPDEFGEANSTLEFTVPRVSFYFHIQFLLLTI